MSYTIGSFNVFKMNYRSDDTIKKNFRRIAEIINAEDFDVVALQEVPSEGALKTILLPALGTIKWECAWAPPKSISSEAAEGYAFIWRKQRLKLIEAGGNPEIYNRYRIKGPVEQGALIRPPYVARFTPQGLVNGGNFELRLINTHIIHSKSTRLVDELSDIDLRKHELKVLSEEIYRLVSTKRYGNNLPAYTILLGDYNLCLAGPGPKIDAEIPITDTRRLKTVQTEKTSLKRPVSQDESKLGPEELDSDVVDPASIDYYSRNYDHFSYEVTLADKMNLMVSRVDALADYYGNNLADYRKEISDHVPIKLVLNLKTK